MAAAFSPSFSAADEIVWSQPAPRRQPSTIGEFIAHDPSPRFGSLNHRRLAKRNAPGPVRLRRAYGAKRTSTSRQPRLNPVENDPSPTSGTSRLSFVPDACTITNSPGIGLQRPLMRFPVQRGEVWTTLFGGLSEA